MPQQTTLNFSLHDQKQPDLIHFDMLCQEHGGKKAQECSSSLLNENKSGIVPNSYCNKTYKQMINFTPFGRLRNFLLVTNCKVQLHILISVTVWVWKSFSEHAQSVQPQLYTYSCSRSGEPGNEATICIEYEIQEWKALHALTTFYKYRVKCATCVVQSILLSETKQLKFSWTESVKCLQICSEWCVIDYCEHNYYTL